MKYTEADERVAKLLRLEPQSAGDLAEIESVILKEIERAGQEGRVSHSVKLKRRLFELRRRAVAR